MDRPSVRKWGEFAVLLLTSDHKPAGPDWYRYFLTCSSPSLRLSLFCLLRLLRLLALASISIAGKRPIRALSKQRSCRRTTSTHDRLRYPEEPQLARIFASFISQPVTRSEISSALVPFHHTSLCAPHDRLLQSCPLVFCILASFLSKPPRSPPPSPFLAPLSALTPPQTLFSFRTLISLMSTSLRLRVRLCVFLPPSNAFSCFLPVRPCKPLDGPDRSFPPSGPLHQPISTNTNHDIRLSAYADVVLFPFL